MIILPESTLDEDILLISSFLHNCINRYGINEVEKWKFEYWLQHGSHLEYTKEHISYYIHSYRTIYQTIKQLLPSAIIGGFRLQFGKPN